MKTYISIFLGAMIPLSLHAGHPWNDVLVIPGGSNAPKDVTEVVVRDEVSPPESSPTVECMVTIDTQHYLRAVDYYGGSRGAILMFRDPKNPPAFSSLYCYLRPYSIKGDETIFRITVPREMLKKAYFAYIPEQGDARYLFSLEAFLAQQSKTTPKPSEMAPLPTGKSTSNATSIAPP
jgi:hypothetical protein